METLNLEPIGSILNVETGMVQVYDENENYSYLFIYIDLLNGNYTWNMLFYYEDTGSYPLPYIEVGSCPL